MNGPTHNNDSMPDSSFGDFLQSLNAIPASDVSQEEEIASEELKALLLLGADPLGDPMRSINASIIHDEIKTCCGCEATLNLPALEVGKRPETWRCTKCGSNYLTGSTLEKTSDIQNAERIHSDVTVPVDKLSMHQTKSLEELVKKMAGAKYIGPNRRKSPRYPISLPAIAMPLDENHQSARSAVDVTLRDISREGLSLFSDISLPQPFLLVDMTPGGFIGAQVVLKVCRSRPLGLMHEVAGTFV